MHRTPQFLKEKNVVDLKFIHRLLHKSCCCLGVTISLAGIFTYFIIMAENGFLPQDLLGIRKVWYSPAVNDLKDRFNQEWTYSARKDLEYCSQTGFFITVVVMQLFTLVIQKTSRESLLQHGMRNYVLNFSLFCSLILAMICCYVPKLNSFLHTYPLNFFRVFVYVQDEIRLWLVLFGHSVVYLYGWHWIELQQTNLKIKGLFQTIASITNDYNFFVNNDKEKNEHNTERSLKFCSYKLLYQTSLGNTGNIRLVHFTPNTARMFEAIDERLIAACMSCMWLSKSSKISSCPFISFVVS
ncbi:Sodium/potassium-transporting ATPase subunit alpha-4 [Araneus ventricosus]|uniref:Sodium/potassium-transporting ATPase subunit alpha-4 n=1 Tax=Araneus ventricosus TaxID=182803 RepID=A0A4Y2D6W8_ARAVE|nr:Sodium/potassium-transporting ATPase subunit alpha-4 [Araneus ventricosus]